METLVEKFLDEQVVQQLQEVFAELAEPVHLLLFRSTENCETCDATQQLLQEVTAVSDRIEFEAYDLVADKVLAHRFHVDKAPGLVVAASNGADIDDLGIHFSGIPSGHEFNTLISDIVLASKRDSGLSPKTREYLKGLTQPLLLQVFVTPTCPYCPHAVLLAHKMAMENPGMIRAEGVEATEFQELSRKFSVSGVPQTVINSGAKIVVGAVPEQALVGEIMRALQN